jgi:DUF4097 and DUF4098 domain-containing protein YvlB
MMVVLREASDHDMEFRNVNGNIDLTIESDVDVNLDAGATRGNITLDDQFGIQVDKGVVGQRARGQIGSGGPLLKIETTNGNIKLAGSPRR